MRPSVTRINYQRFVEFSSIVFCARVRSSGDRWTGIAGSGKRPGVRRSQSWGPSNGFRHRRRGRATHISGEGRMDVAVDRESRSICGLLRSGCGPRDRRRAPCPAAAGAGAVYRDARVVRRSRRRQTLSARLAHAPGHARSCLRRYERDHREGHEDSQGKPVVQRADPDVQQPLAPGVPPDRRGQCRHRRAQGSGLRPAGRDVQPGRRKRWQHTVAHGGPARHPLDRGCKCQRERRPHHFPHHVVASLDAPHAHPFQDHLGRHRHRRRGLRAH